MDLRTHLDHGLFDMKKVLIRDSTYRVLSADAKKRALTPDELIEIILKREYKLK